MTFLSKQEKNDVDNQELNFQIIKNLPKSEPKNSMKRSSCNIWVKRSANRKAAERARVIIRKQCMVRGIEVWPWVR